MTNTLASGMLLAMLRRQFLQAGALGLIARFTPKPGAAQQFDELKTARDGRARLLADIAAAAQDKAQLTSCLGFVVLNKFDPARIGKRVELWASATRDMVSGDVIAEADGKGSLHLWLFTHVGSATWVDHMGRQTDLEVLGVSYPHDTFEPVAGYWAVGSSAHNRFREKVLAALQKHKDEYDENRRTGRGLQAIDGWMERVIALV